jgi:hypothetical protein
MYWTCHLIFGGLIRTPEHAALALTRKLSTIASDHDTEELLHKKAAEERKACVGIMFLILGRPGLSPL